jgi:hypothetical protein
MLLEVLPSYDRSTIDNIYTYVCICNISINIYIFIYIIQM